MFEDPNTHLASRWHACGGDDVQSAVLAVVVTIVALILLVDRKSAFYLEDTYYYVIYVFEYLILLNFYWFKTTCSRPTAVS